MAAADTQIDRLPDREYAAITAIQVRIHAGRGQVHTAGDDSHRTKRLS